MGTAWCGRGLEGKPWDMGTHGCIWVGGRAAGEGSWGFLGRLVSLVGPGVRGQDLLRGKGETSKDPETRGGSQKHKERFALGRKGMCPLQTSGMRRALLLCLIVAFPMDLCMFCKLS